MAIEAMTSYSPYPPEGGVGAELAVAEVQPVVEVSEVVVEVEPTVRAATIEDVPALAAIELDAYHDVYGRDPDEDTVRDVEEKYRERVELLGDFVRVLDHPEHGVYGMLVCCPTSLGREDFLAEERDLTQNDSVRAIYDPDGKNGYIVNLAVARGHQGRGDHFRLFADALGIGAAMNAQRVYFESRLPGFDRWLSGRLADAEETGETLPDTRALAEEYWHLTEVKGGVEKPKDKLLRLYTDFGATPLRLIEEAWKPDISSGGYGVLCEFKMPNATDDEEVAERKDDDDADGGSAIDDATIDQIANGFALGEVIATETEVPVENPEQHIGFMRSAVEWAKGHKKGVAIGATALASLAYVLASGGEQQVLDSARNVEWAGPAYVASMAAYFGGMAMMLTGAGQKARNFFRSRRETIDAIADRDTSSSNETLVKTGFWVNATSAVAAASVATAAVIESLPPSAWSILTVPLADLYSTLAIRSWLYGHIK